jgi:uncharacterized protein YecT (DUF1311 family)
MRHLLLIAFLSMGAVAGASAQEPSGVGSEDPFEALAKNLREAKSCDAAVAKIRDSAFGSSVDTQLAPIVITKCEKTFFDKLSPAAKKHYGEEMQLCAYEYAQQEGTMYMSAAALCQVDVAARFAADPALANQPPARASFDCSRARTPLEMAICSDIRLGHADIVLSRVYSGVLKGLSEESEKSALIQSERQWLQRVPAQCSLSGSRFSEKSLNCIRDEFELRFSALDTCDEGIAAVGPIADCLRNVADDLAPSAPAPRASFDCETPSSALEIVICADAELGQQDIQLAQAYGDAGAVMLGEQHKDLIDSERQWLRFVSKTCPLGAVGGIPSVIARACVRNAFQTRIAQLPTCAKKEPQQRIQCLNDFHLSDNKNGSQR